MTIIKASSYTINRVLSVANNALLNDAVLYEIQIVFLEEDNPIEDMMEGKFRFRIEEK